MTFSKRMFDILFALALCVVLGPVILGLTLALLVLQRQVPQQEPWAPLVAWAWLVSRLASLLLPLWLLRFPTTAHQPRHPRRIDNRQVGSRHQLRLVVS